MLLLVRCSRLGQVIVEVSLWLFPLYHRSIVGSPITVYLPCKMQISQRLLQIHCHRLDGESARMGIVDALISSISGRCPRCTPWGGEIGT